MAAKLRVFNANVESKQTPPVGPALRDTKPDVAVFTEAYYCREHLRKVADSLDYRHKQFTQADGLGHEGPNIAVLIRPGFRIVKWEPMKMSEPWWGPQTGNKREPRVYPKLLLADEDLVPDLNWKIVAAHFPPGGPDGGSSAQLQGKNKAAWAESRDRVVKYGNDHPEGPYLIVGDINATHDEVTQQIAKQLEGSVQVESLGKVDHVVARRIAADSAFSKKVNAPVGHGWGVVTVTAQDRDTG